MSAPATFLLSGPHVEWLQGPPLLPEIFPPMDKSHHLCHERELACIDFGRVVVASFMVQILLALLFAALCSPLKVFRALSIGEKLYWVQSCVAIVHAMFAFAYSWQTIMMESHYFDEDFLLRHQPLESYIGVSMGYFLYDFALSLVGAIFCEEFRSIGMTMHHLTSIVGLATPLTFGYCTYAAGFWLLTEASTTFVNLRWILAKAGLKQHPVYLINGIFMMVLFFLFRVLLAPYYWYKLYTQREVVLQLPTPFLAVILVGGTFFTFLNMFWFTKILKGALNLLSPGKYKYKIPEEEREERETMRRKEKNTKKMKNQ